MCQVNFLSEFHSIMRYCKNNSLPLRERMLWIALFYIANDRAIYDATTGAYDWPDDYFAVSNNELSLYCCLDKRGIDDLRNKLQQRGLIRFLKGEKNKRNPAYMLNYLSVNVGYKSVPNDVPNISPNDVPNHVPNDAPSRAPYPKEDIMHIDYSKKLGIDNAYRSSERACAAAAQRIIDEIEREGLLPMHPQLHEFVTEALCVLGFTPTGIVRTAYINRGRIGDFAAELGTLPMRIKAERNRVCEEESA